LCAFAINDIRADTLSFASPFQHIWISHWSLMTILREVRCTQCCRIINHMFDGFNVAAELQEQLAIFLLDAEFLDVESTEPVEQI